MHATGKKNDVSDALRIVCEQTFRIAAAEEFQFASQKNQIA
jgi:hypothetical protein